MCGWWRLALVLVVGCWSTSDTVDGFTTTQWDHLVADLTVPADYDTCALTSHTYAQSHCDEVAELGRELFFSTALSSTGTVSCASCHEAPHLDAGGMIVQGWFADSRTAAPVSPTVAGWTGRNTMSLLNIGLKDHLASRDPDPRAHQVFTWSGKYASPGAVIELPLIKTMGSSPAQLVDTVQRDPLLWSEYVRAFPEPTTKLGVYTNLTIAFEAYLRRLISVGSPFDAYLGGERDAISESARRGFQVFVGKGMCLECHDGPLLGGKRFINTGVPQTGAHVPASDLGRASVTGDDADLGAFLTPSLRNVAQTAPYMHDGALATLADVIAFYRAGGVPGGYAGTRDPRIVPIEMTDEDAQDLEAFLRTLTGHDVALSLGPPTTACTTATAQPGITCAGACVDPVTSQEHCGGCDHACAATETCMGACYPLMCPPPSRACAHACVDVMSDPANCGDCGLLCGPAACIGGVCALP